MSYSTQEQPLTLQQVAGYLLADQMIDRLQYDKILQIIPLQKNKIHPLISIASLKWPNLAQPKHYLSLENLTRWLAQRFTLPYIHIDPLKTDFAHLTRLVSYAYAERFKILPLKLENNLLTIATAEPLLREWEDELSKVLNLKIQRIIANPQDISHYLNEFYNLQHSLNEAAQDNKLKSSTVWHDFEQLLELENKDSKPAAGNQHIVHIVDWLLQYAFAQRASDIHLEPRRKEGHVRFRIDGQLHMVHKIPTQIMLAMVSRFKMLARMNLAERRRPQDGRIKTLSPETGKTVELRLSTMPTTFGEKLVARIFDPEVLVKNFNSLGFSKRDTMLWQRMTSHAHGIILITGPTGSGKTSTLYSALKHLARPELNICTIEDPIEVVEPEFNQMQVNPSIDVSFATGVRTLLRQDPDIIMVGEIRDQETAEVSVQAALTGHLVLSTLHTNDAPSAITRLFNIGVAPYLIDATLLGVVAQRLVRTLCPQCKQKQACDEHSWQSLIQPLTWKKPEFIYGSQGCDHCRQTGYHGRTGLFEIMPVTPAIAKLINKDSSLSTMRAVALKEGLYPLRFNGAQKIAAGLTTFEEVLRVIGINSL